MAPAIAVHEPPLAGQRCQAMPKSSESPAQSPRSRRKVRPTASRPLMVGEDVDSGERMTRAVDAEKAVVLPAEFVATTRTRIALPRSAATMV